MMNIPKEMNAITIDRFGGPEVISFTRQPVPKVGAGQVLIKVSYAGVGTWDPLMREGIFAEIMGEQPNFPMILGTDGSGTIAEVAEDVDRFSVGDQVYMVGANLYAEYVVLDAQEVSKIPDNLPMDQAGALPVAALTSLHGLVYELKIKMNETVLIHGASGDVGHVAVQIAKLMGARVLAVASGADGVEAVKAYGADMVIDGRKDDIAEAARSFAPEGLDAILTFIAGAGLDEAISCVGKGGRVAYPLGVEPEPQSRDHVSFYKFDLTLDSPATIGEKMAKLNELVASQPFEVKVAGTFSLAEAAQAHEALSKHRIGKILLKM